MMNDQPSTVFNGALASDGVTSWLQPAVQLELEPQDKPVEIHSAGTGTPEQLNQLSLHVHMIGPNGSPGLALIRLGRLW